MLSDLTLKDECLSVIISGSGTAYFDYFGCAIMRVIQSASTADPISESSSPARLMLISSLTAVLVNDGLALQIKWPDMDDSVCYEGDFLAAYALPTPMLAMPEPTIWDLPDSKMMLSE